MQGAWRPVVVVLCMLVAVDLVSKAIALHFVSDGGIPEGAAFGFTLVLNTSGLGAWASNAYAGRSGDDFLAMSAGSMALVPYLFTARRLEWNAGWTFVAGLGVFGIGALVWPALFPTHHLSATYLSVALYYFLLRRVVSDTTRRILAGYGIVVGVTLVTRVATHFAGHVPHDVGVHAARTAVTFVSLSVLWLVRRTPWRVPFVLFSAAAIGNGLSLLFPPHAIVDFFYVGVLAKVLGHGVMNVADLYWDAALASACVLAAGAAFRRLRGAAVSARP